MLKINMEAVKIIALDINESLQQEQILTAFVVNNKTGCIIASLNHVYDKKTIVSDISQNWIKTIDTFDARAKEKGISDEHIACLQMRLIIIMKKLCSAYMIK